MSDGISVVVPCFNSAARLPATLSHLAGQSVPDGLNWEIIVVDNASTDATAEVARATWSRTGSDVSFRVVSQPIKGLSAARVKGFERARYAYVLFCDDDNWLDSDYVRLAYQIMTCNPNIGALGGRGEAQCAMVPPDWFHTYCSHYAVGPQGARSGDITTGKGHLYGAGFVIRKEGWERLQALGFDFLLTDRHGTALTNGGDMELCLALRLLGYRVWYDERLAFTHFITRDRLKWDYFLRLVAGASEGVPFTEAYWKVLSSDGAFSNKPSRLQWIRECFLLVKWMAPRYRFELSSDRPGMEGDRSQKMFHEWKGRMRGWLRLRSRYAAITHRLASLRVAEAG